MNAEGSKGPVEILLVEDNPADIRLTEEAFLMNACDHILHVAQDGAEAKALLTEGTNGQGPPRPDLILLDINLPRMNGHELLAWLKEEPGLAEIPVVMLTTSEAAEDVHKSYKLHASSYVTKPVDMDGFIDLIGVLERYWISTARLPTRE